MSNRIAVYHSPLSLLHDPPYEILSGCLQNYVESPERCTIILRALLSADKQEESEVTFEEFALNWTRENVVDEGILDAVRQVHSEEYVEFLRNIYAEWIAEGGSKVRSPWALPFSASRISRRPTQVCVLPECFLRQDLLLEPDTGMKKREGAIQKAGRFSFDLSSPITAGTAVCYEVATYFTGATNERGRGEGEGLNVNFPLPLGTGNEEYLETLEKGSQIIKEWDPQYLVISLGVDTYIDDPLTDFELTLEAYPVMGRIIRSINIPSHFLMEGGYCLPMIGKCVRSVLEGFAAAP
ncbi:hypothetical protein P7C70_g8045, partial [Phenoliferia sp. Uapishka_3]